ncbi:hypothetical protein SODALDRAFT_327520 [Sodiomyces alkalinus F11]|uniref:Uncharacterized protein n=1 Tax=Sodiomyces alkalinus (strain CBS 110278 / VKM F-3762 / F11) TaxID=1314773 RepID=A0A3N2Q9J5_SODAK|nr:hypothetical protein SODALDRAFT_327520 [Sodiomyces alkalinus F11]ROT43328.1 hypothetical protein SODALDRAFT_327520 [Sodiomyces alkalinus F11]
MDEIWALCLSMSVFSFFFFFFFSPPSLFPSHTSLGAYGSGPHSSGLSSSSPLLVLPLLEVALGSMINEEV